MNDKTRFSISTKDSLTKKVNCSINKSDPNTSFTTNGEIKQQVFLDHSDIKGLGNNQLQDPLLFFNS